MRVRKNSVEGSRVPWTNELCREPGEYVSKDEDRRRITVRRGRPFPECPGCGRPVQWKLDIVRQQLERGGMEL